MKNKKLLIGIIAGVVVAITAIIRIISIPSSSKECDHTYGDYECINYHLLNLNGADDMYDIRLSFLPFTFGLDLDYAITLTY